MNVLIAQSNENLGMLWKRHLERLNAQVMLVQTGDAAVCALAQQDFDVIVLDPPKFVNSQRDLKRAARGYKDINLLAFQLLREHGILATFSCSGLVSADLYQKIVFGAVIDSGRNAQIIQPLTQVLKPHRCCNHH